MSESCHYLSNRFSTAPRMALLLALALAVTGCGGTEATSVRYEITFVANWNDSTQPYDNFPSNPHFSPLVAAVHSSDVGFWKLGDTASNPTYIFTEPRIGYRMPEGEKPSEEPTVSSSRQD